MIVTVLNEEWSPINKTRIDFTGLYEISNYGRVKSLKRIVKNGLDSHRLVKERIIKPFKCKDYWCVLLHDQGKTYHYRINQLIGLHFIPNPNNYPNVLHIDNNRGNNFIHNLKWGTQSDNLQDAWNDGLMENNRKVNSERAKTWYGENNSWHKITEVQAKEIKLLYAEQIYNQYELASMFSVDQSTISYIINGKRWKYLNKAA